MTCTFRLFLLHRLKHYYMRFSHVLLCSLNLVPLTIGLRSTNKQVCTSIFVFSHSLGGVTGAMLTLLELYALLNSWILQKLDDHGNKFIHHNGDNCSPWFVFPWTWMCNLLEVVDYHSFSPVSPCNFVNSNVSCLSCIVIVAA